jgi:nucleoside-diphosphate-sugar epimerase
MDVVVHLAAAVHKLLARRNEERLYRIVNVEATEALARAAVEAGVRRFVFVSSVKVNGETTAPGREFSEDDLPRPEDAYGRSKRDAEEMLRGISAKNGLGVVVLRPPLVYGPEAKANFLTLLRWVDSGIPLPLASIGNRRSLVYLGNLVDAIVACVRQPEAGGQTFLVSDGGSTSTPDLIRHIANALQKPARLFPIPVPALKFVGRALATSTEMEKLISSLVVNDSRIRTVLGWKPPYCLKEGLLATAKWYRSLPA